MKPFGGYILTNEGLIPSIVVFAADNATAVFCQDTFEPYVTPETPYRVVYMKQSLESIRSFPYTLIEPVLFLVEEEFEKPEPELENEPEAEEDDESVTEQTEKFITALKHRKEFRNVPYIIIRYGDKEEIPDDVPAPEAFIDIRESSENLLKAVADVLKISYDDAEEWKCSLYR